MKKALQMILPVLTAAAVMITAGFWVRNNVPSDSLHIRELPQTLESTPSADTPSEPVPTDGGLVDINTADLARLMTLPGIGEVLAQRIIDYRTAHGPFASPEDLLNVSGIGYGKLEDILNLITTGGTT